jgi:hypothetical protein
MRNSAFALLIIIVLFLVKGCKPEEVAPSLPQLPKKNFTITGRILKSCGDETPIAGLKLALNPEYRGFADVPMIPFTFTDSLGNFSFTGDYDFPHLDLVFLDKNNWQKSIFRFLKPDTYDLGNVYLNNELSSPVPISCIVRYNLKHSTFRDGDSVVLNYQDLHPRNKQLIYRRLTDFEEPDTILVDLNELEYLVHPLYSTRNSANFYVESVSKGIRNKSGIKIGSACGVAEATIPIL